MYIDSQPLQKILNTRATGSNLIDQIEKIYLEMVRLQTIMNHIKTCYPVLWSMAKEDMERLLKPLEDTKDERRH